MNLSCIILAAGTGARLGRPKLNLALPPGDSLALRSVHLAQSLGAGDIILVTGAEPLAGQDRARGLREIHNSSWSQGMGNSLALGAQSIQSPCDALLVLLVDQYRIERKDLNHLLTAWQARPQQPAIAEWNDASGPPALFPGALLATLARLDGEVGARSLLQNRPVTRVPISNAAWDIDSPDDLREARLWAQSRT